MNSEDCVNAPDAGASSEVTVMINVRSSNGSKFPVQTKLDVTVALLKEVVAGNSGVPKELQRLIYKGKILKDDQTLESYGLFAFFFTFTLNFSFSCVIGFSQLSSSFILISNTGEILHPLGIYLHSQFIDYTCPFDLLLYFIRPIFLSRY